MEKSFTAKLILWKIMRICATQGMMLMLICGVVMAHENSAQILERKITISVKDVSLEQALTTIERAGAIKIFYSIDQLGLTDMVSINATDQKIGYILDNLLSPYQISYSVFEKDFTVVLKKRSSETDVNFLREKKSKFFVPHTITGVVIDDSTKQQLAGVNVLVKGSLNGTSTDANGKYSLQVEDNIILSFSFIGYKTKEVEVGTRSVVDVALQEDVSSLKEVVINAGYWHVKQKEETGNIAKVAAEDIEKQPVSNPLAALQGRVAGLEVTQSTGVPGGNFKVQIRGQNSIANGNDPLYIIDGVPFTSTSLAFNETSGGIFADGSGNSPLNSINPSDIESIEVLKDADATAIYGSRGANGVILITTKKGKAGKTKIDFNYYQGGGKVASKMDLLKTPTYVSMRKEAYKNDGLDYKDPNSVSAPDLTLWDTTRNTDWQKKLLGGTARYQDAQLSISGGERLTQFSIGGGYHKETTVFPGNSGDQRLSAHASINHTSSNQKLKVNMSITYAINNTNLLKQDLTGIALSLAPDAPALYDKNGNLNWGKNAWNGTSINTNPIAYTRAIYQAKTNNLIANSMIGYAILPNLEIKSNLGYTNTDVNAVTTSPLSSVDPALASIVQNSSAFSTRTVQSWIVEPQLNWRPKLLSGQFDILFGSSLLNKLSNGNAQYANGFASEALMKNINAANSIVLSTSDYSLYRYQAFFGRVNYSLHEKYIINATGRRDGSSRFGPGKQFANFGAVGAAWIFSNEQFAKQALSFLSFGKLRSSYGITGNDQIGDYQYLDTYSPAGSGPYQGIVGLSPQRLYNPNFAWETNKKYETGLELGFLQGKLSGSISYYINRSSNQLVGYTLPPTTGFGSIQRNLPATVQNSGLEIQLNSVNIQTREIKWTSFFNFSLPTNKLISFPNLETSQYANTYVVGQPLSILKLYNYKDVNTTSGIYEFNDVNKDGTIGIADKQAIKFAGRKFFGGLGNTIQFKGFQFDFLFQFVKQTARNYFSYGAGQAPGHQYNIPTDMLSRWQKDGDHTSIQKFSTSGESQNAYSMFISSDRTITDASFIRLKNIALSYTILKTWMDKLRIDNARIFIQGQNLFKITSYKGLDPENQNAILPPLRVLTAGIHLTL